MKRTLNALAAALVLVAITTAVVAAHDLFIKMDTYHLPAGAPVDVPILNGTFEKSENSIIEDRVADVSLVVEGRRTKMGMDTWNAEGDTTFLGIRTGDPGTYLIGVSTRVNSISLDAAEFNQYLASDGVIDVLQARAMELELNEDAWEQYSKHVKAIYQVGERRSGGLDVVLGYPAELVPLDNPYEKSVGDELSFRALVDGKPVFGQLVIAGGEGSRGEIDEREARTDRDGVVRFRVDQPGRWYLKFINMQKTDAEGLDYESKWATISFEIR